MKKLLKRGLLGLTLLTGSYLAADESAKQEEIKKPVQQVSSELDQPIKAYKISDDEMDQPVKAYPINDDTDEEKEELLLKLSNKDVK